MAAASSLLASECEWVVKNTFLEVGRQANKPLRQRSSSECGVIAEAGLTSVDAACEEEDKLETASIATMDFDKESLDDASTAYEPSSAATEDTASSQDLMVPASTLSMLQAAALRTPWMPMVQVIVVDSSKLMAEQKPAKSGRAQHRARKSAGFDTVPGEEGAQKDLTTVMMRNLPVELSRDMLLQLLNDQGFAGEYNFVYMPIDFVKQVGLGYAFVNLVSNDVAPRFWRSFDRFRSWPVCSTKVCRLGWSTPHQGLQKHIERYRNSPLMHKDVPDEIRPALFENGARIEFPPPTKAIHAPRLRASHRLSEFWKKPESD
jgi:hypothetical protein